jgi:branched-chain amino acid transport system permease protein
MALAVLLIGGLGSLKGAFVGSLFVGLADNFGKVLVPELALFIIFGSVAIVLAFKPTGLFGKTY